MGAFAEVNEGKKELAKDKGSDGECDDVVSAAYFVVGKVSEGRSTLNEMRG